MADIMVWEWERFTSTDEEIEQCEDLHDTLADATRCANLHWAQYHPNRLAKFLVTDNGLLELVEHRPFLPSKPKTLFQALVWGRY